MMHRWLPAAVWLGGMLLPGAAAAELYTLEQAVDQALAQNPQLAAADERARAARAERRAVQGQRLPQLDLNYSIRRSDNPLDAFADKLNTRSVVQSDLAVTELNNPDPSTLYATQLSLQMPVYTGGALSAQVRGAKAAQQASESQAGRARALTVHHATQAYLAVQAGQEGEQIAQDAVDAARQHANTTARLVRQGRIIVSDRLTAEVNLAAMQAVLEKARAQTHAALQQLKRVMGLAANADVRVQPWPAQRNAVSPGPATDIVERALARRRDIQALESQVAAARAQVGAARAAYLPNIDLVASRNWYDDEFGTDSDSWSVMGVARLNLFAGGRYANRAAAAQYKLRDAEDQLRALRLQVQNEIYDALNTLDTAGTRLKIAGTHVDTARRTVRLVKDRYGQGRTILIDLLQAERALLETRHENLSAALDYELAALNLRLAEGSLGETDARNDVR